MMTLPIESSIICFQLLSLLIYLKVFPLRFGKKIFERQKYIVGNIYRMPSYISDDVTSFTKEYTDLLNIIRTRSKFVYVCGDVNF